MHRTQTETPGVACTGMNSLAEVDLSDEAIEDPAMNDKIDRLEDLMIEHAAAVDLDECLTHYFSDGIYAREIRIPAGHLVTSLVHKTECLATCSAGAVWVYTPGRPGFRLVQAPATLISTPGARRVGIFEQETVWTTYHNVGDEKDIGKIEEMLYEPMPEIRKKRRDQRIRAVAAGREQIGALLRELNEDGVCTLGASTGGSS